MNVSQGHSGTKVRCESCLFSQGKTPEFTKISEIHELFVLALSLDWFAGATPELILSLGCYRKGGSPKNFWFPQALPPPPPLRNVPVVTLPPPSPKRSALY